MWTDRDAGTVTFKLREPGFLRRYEGTWTIKAADGQALSAYNTPQLTPAPSAAAAGVAAVASAAARLGSSSSRGVLPLALPASATAAAPLAALSLMQSLPSSRALTALSHIQQQLQANLCETLTNAVTNVSSLSRHVFAAPQAAQTASLFGRAELAHQPHHHHHHHHQQQQQCRVQQVLPSNSRIQVETLTSPKISPPYPLNQILKSQAKGQVQDMLHGLVSAAAVKMDVGPLTC